MHGQPWTRRRSDGTFRRRPATVAFARAKYARPLLVDAGSVSSYDRFEREGEPHVLDFYDILLVTRGRGQFRLDHECHAIEPGTVFFTRPGEVRQWRTTGPLDGACIFFRGEFALEAFSDPRFLERFAFFRPDRPSAALTLDPRERRAYLAAFSTMIRELAALPADAGHALRAVLYDVLVHLHRAYTARHCERQQRDEGVVSSFRELVERDFRRRHRVAAYAAAMGLSPGHLGALCRASLQKSPGQYIRERLLLEARRLLLYTDRTSADIAYALGFDDPSYFVRFFKRETGISPIRYRRREQPVI